MGYRLAIVPGLLLKAVIGACDEALAELKATHVHPVPRGDMTVREASTVSVPRSGMRCARASATRAASRGG